MSLEGRGLTWISAKSESAEESKSLELWCSRTVVAAFVKDASTGAFASLYPPERL
jgi:hypothetical protein